MRSWIPEVSFKLSKEIEKDVFSLITSVGQRKILSSHEETNLRPSDSILRCSTTEPQRLYGEQGPLRSLYMICVLHTATISSIDSVFFCFVNWIREMVSFKLGEEIEKDVFRLVTSLGQRKNSESPWGTLDLRTSADPSSMQDACHMWTSTSSHKKAYKSDSPVLERMIYYSSFRVRFPIREWFLSRLYLVCSIAAWVFKQQAVKVTQQKPLPILRHQANATAFTSTIIILGQQIRTSRYTFSK